MGQICRFCFLISRKDDNIKICFSHGVEYFKMNTRYGIINEVSTTQKDAEHLIIGRNKKKYLPKKVSIYKIFLLTEVVGVFLVICKMKMSELRLVFWKNSETKI